MTRSRRYCSAVGSSWWRKEQKDECYEKFPEVRQKDSRVHRRRATMVRSDRDRTPLTAVDSEAVLNLEISWFTVKYPRFNDNHVSSSSSI